MQLSTSPQVWKNYGQINQSVRKLKLNYRFSEEDGILGTGAFGTVYLAQNLHDPSLKVAIKVLNKQKCRRMESVSREIAVLNTLDHPNIVKYYECFDDVDYIYMVMEYVNGAPLSSKISKDPSNRLSEY